MWAKGGEGGLALAEEVVRLCDEGDEAGRGADTFQFAYDDDLNLREKIEAIATRVYRADGVDFDAKAAKELAKLEKLGFGDMPVCMAKTQYSFSDDQKKLGAPRGFRITVRDVKVSAGAGFVVALTGNIMTMPGLGKSPAAFKIDVERDRKDHGALLGKTCFGSSALVQWCASARGSRCMLETMVGYRTLIALSVWGLETRKRL